MARIAISLCGEGRGHASRIATLVERLPPGHDIRIFTAAEGFEFLARRVREFVARLERYAAAADAHRGRMDGAPAVLDVIASHLAAVAIAP